MKYEMDNFYTLLQAFIKSVPRKIIKCWDTKHRDNALLDESTWGCKVCGTAVEDEKDETGADIPHPACEECFD